MPALPYAMITVVPYLLVLSVLVGCACASAQVALVPKDQRTAAQRKIDSRLLQAIDNERAGVKRKPADDSPLAVKFDKDHRALVDIRTEVTAAARNDVTRLGGAIVSTSAEHRSIVAWMPLLKLEELAAAATVLSIVTAPQATTHR